MSAMPQKRPPASPGDYPAAALWQGGDFLPQVQLAQSGHLTLLPSALDSISTCAYSAAGVVHLQHLASGRQFLLADALPISACVQQPADSCITMLNAHQTH